jgi:RND family efflux transporter MFP subunit
MKFIAFCLMGTLMTSCLRKPQTGAPPQMPPPAVGVTKIAAEPVVEWEEFSARVEAVASVSLSPRVSGYLDEVRFEAGTMVEKGQVLFQIDPLPYKAKHAQTAALLQRAEAALSTARSEAKRVPELLLARAMTQEEADARLSNYQQAEASHAAAAADHLLAQLDLERTQVPSPISGRVSRAFVTAGNPVTTATVLTNIVSVDPVHAYADIDENTYLRVHDAIAKKQVKLDDKNRIPVQLRVADETGYPHQGWLESLDNRITSATGSIILRAVIPNADGKLLPGMFARIRVPLSTEKPTILVAETAIKTDQGQKFVYVIDEKSLAQYRPIVLGPAVEKRRIIRSGLKEGDVVVVNGLAKIFMPGMPVKGEFETKETP